jgi:hypothetical protein
MGVMVVEYHLKVEKPRRMRYIPDTNCPVKAAIVRTSIPIGQLDSHDIRVLPCGRCSWTNRTHNERWLRCRYRYKEELILAIA